VGKSIDQVDAAEERGAKGFFVSGVGCGIRTKVIQICEHGSIRRSVFFCIEVRALISSMDPSLMTGVGYAGGAAAAGEAAAAWRQVNRISDESAA
jgi:hypothetical protein